MFKSKGTRNFYNCQNKRIEYTGAGANNGARLSCEGAADGIKTEYESYSYRGGARRSLARSVGSAACRTCPFADKTPTEVNFYKADLASSAAARLEAETAELKARDARQQVLDEIAARVTGEQAQIGNDSNEITPQSADTPQQLPSAQPQPEN